MTEFSDLSLNDVTVIYSSAEKGTEVLRARYMGEAVLVKRVLCRSEANIASLKKEIFHYEKLNGFEGFPSLVSCGTDYFMTRYVPGATVFQRGADVASNDNFKTVFSRTCKAVENFNYLSVGGSKINSLSFFLWFFKRSRGQAQRLLLSGPKNTFSSRWNVVTCRFFYYLMMPFSVFFLAILSLVFSVFYCSRMGSRYHGDLHGNNVLLSDNEKVFIVDFETVMERPGRILDVSYFLASTVWVCGGIKSYGGVVRSLFINEGRIFYFLVKLFFGYMIYCSGLNNRFRVGCGL